MAGMASPLDGIGRVMISPVCAANGFQPSPSEAPVPEASWISLRRVIDRFAMTEFPLRIGPVLWHAVV